jgi:hypothetical protein
MIFPQTRIQALLPAFLALAFFALSSVNAQNSGGMSGVVAIGETISMNGSAVIDSFDPTDPSKSTNGLYDPAKRQSNGNVNIFWNTNSDLRNAFVYGDLYSGRAGASVKNCANVQGTIGTPFDINVGPANDPTWAYWTEYAGGGNPPAGGTFTVNGTTDNPTWIKVNGDFTVPGGKTFSIVPDTQTDRYLNLWVTGKLTISGSGYLVQNPFVHVTWFVDKDISIGGNNYQNQSGKAANVSLQAVGSTGKINITGPTCLIAMINAPLRTLNISGSGGLSGSLYCNSLVLGAGSAVHCDEALLWTPPTPPPPPPSGESSISCEGQAPGASSLVDQYVEAEIQFTGQPDLIHTGAGVGGRPDNGTGYLQGAYRLTFLDQHGRLFTLKSVDLAEYSTVYAFPTSMTFIGSKVDGTTVSQTFVTDGQMDSIGGLPDFQTFTFGPEWTDLLRVDMESDYGFSIDNIVVER